MQPAIAVALPTPKTAVTYGNTLTWESIPNINSWAATKNGWTITPHTFVGTGFCTWNTWLENDIATKNPSIIGVAPMSNPPDPTGADLTCGKDANGIAFEVGSPEYYAEFENNVNWFFATATASGAKVVYFESPPVSDPVRNAVLKEQGVRAKVIAGQYHGVSYSKAIFTALSKNGKYTDTKPCLADELALPDCVDGQIIIRSQSPPIQAGSHLCPGGLPPEYPWFCETYSSGEYRFAKALVNTLVNPPAPILP